jgi:hypothetical protein
MSIFVSKVIEFITALPAEKRFSLPRPITKLDVKLAIQTLAILFWIQRSSASFFSARLPLNAALQIRNDYLK